ncbi:MAG: hypothetical protein ACYTGQ_10085 [Planctomycetota bacterium]|jgi:hypothetical protein
MDTAFTPFRCLIIAAFVTALAISPLVVSPASGSEDEPPIIQHMDDINHGYKLLRRQARGPSFDEESVDLVIKMQAGALAAMHESFPIAEQAGAGKDKVILGYKKQMAKVVKVLLDMEIALIEKRDDDVVKGIEALGSLKSDGHDEYTED